ncbi:MAG TPA: hypothetical protein VKQ30_16235 [Ktedonobacterales bacterium]|nr:hypothetical protein [Ktedonobacterales bacterium]
MDERTIFTTPSDEQASWQYKAIVATRGNQTLLGAIFLQIIGKNAKHPPQIVGTASVDEDGLCWSVLRKQHGLEIAEGIVCLGSIADIRDEFRRLADHLKLNDDERKELFVELRKWVAVDLRADHAEMAHSGQTLH